jgi:hypothetical protein
MTPRNLFPGRLLSAVNHAESFCIFLSRMDVRPGDATARAWVMGRRQEIGAFVEQVGRDYRTKKLDENAATACIDAYLGSLHASVATHFGEDSPSCCKPFLAVTAVPLPTDNTPTTVFVRPRPADPPARPPRPEPPRPLVPPPPDSSTWIDVEPDQILAGLATRRA